MAFSVFSNPKCPSGSEFGLMVSGMSKFARRNNAEKANWCSVDLYLAGFQNVNNETEKRTRENYRSRFINRFPVAIIEDNMPYCWWVLKHLKRFTELCMKSYADNEINSDVLKLIHLLIFNIANQDKCRMLQHLREVGDEEFKMIEEAKPSQAINVFLELLKKYNGYDQNSIDSCIDVYKLRKKPIILSAAYSYVKYGKLFPMNRPLLHKYKNEYNESMKKYLNEPTPEWSDYPFLFDKHVSSSIAKKYGVTQIKGWKGFIENEEKTCWDNAPEFYIKIPLCIELKNKYWEKRMNQ
jgi:hypothetical protein